MNDRKIEERYAMELLRRHINELSECSRNFAKLKYKLYSFGIITNEDCEEMDVPGKSAYQRFADLYRQIPRVGTNWLNALTIAWINTENYSAIQVLLGITVHDLEEKGINAFTHPSDFTITLNCKEGSSLVHLTSVNNIVNVESQELRDLKASSNGVWFGITDLVHNFSGRASELEKLHALVTENRSSIESSYAIIASIYGLGGIGKTSLARKYAWAYAKYFDNNVIWIPSETKNLMTSAFRDLAKLIGIHNYDQLQAKEKVACVYQWFGDKRSLFIFDNVEDMNGINGVSNFFPIGIRNRPYILMTSRRSDLVQTGRILPRDVLSDDDAITLLKNQDCLPNATTDTYVKLYETLGKLPLALQQAMSYIKSNLGLYKDMDHAIRAYLKEYEKQHVKLMSSSFVSSDGYQNSVCTTWNITIKMIKKNENLGDMAEYVLQILAYLHPDKIYIEYLLSLIWELEIPPYLLKCHSLNEIRATIQILSKYTMITLQNGVINVHRLLQHIIRQKCNQEKEIVTQVVKFLYYDDLTDFHDQKILNMITILPFFEKYKLESTCISFRKQSESVDFINNLIVGTSRDDALDLIRYTGKSRDDLELAVKFIKEIEIPNSFELYIKACKCLRNNFPQPIFTNQRVARLSVFILTRKLSSRDKVQVIYVTKLLLQLSSNMFYTSYPICCLKTAVKVLGGDINIVDDVLNKLVRYGVYVFDENKNSVYSSHMRRNNFDWIILYWLYSSEYFEKDIDFHDVSKLNERINLDGIQPDVKRTDDAFNQFFYYTKELTIMLRTQFALNIDNLTILCFISEMKFLQDSAECFSNQYLQLYCDLMHWRENELPSKLPRNETSSFSNKLKVKFEALNQLSSSLHENRTPDQLNSLILPLQEMTQELQEINKIKDETYQETAMKKKKKKCNMI